jgi:hypothetical protein
MSWTRAVSLQQEHHRGPAKGSDDEHKASLLHRLVESDRQRHHVLDIRSDPHYHRRSLPDWRIVTLARRAEKTPTRKAQSAFLDCHATRAVLFPLVSVVVQRQHPLIYRAKLE